MFGMPDNSWVSPTGAINPLGAATFGPYGMPPGMMFQPPPNMMMPGAPTPGIVNPNDMAAYY